MMPVPIADRYRELLQAVRNGDITTRKAAVTFKLLFRKTEKQTKLDPELTRILREVLGYIAGHLNTRQKVDIYRFAITRHAVDILPDRFVDFQDDDITLYEKDIVSYYIETPYFMEEFDKRDELLALAVGMIIKYGHRFSVSVLDFLFKRAHRIRKFFATSYYTDLLKFVLKRKVQMWMLAFVFGIISKKKILSQRDPSLFVWYQRGMLPYLPDSIFDEIVSIVEKKPHDRNLACLLNHPTIVFKKDIYVQSIKAYYSQYRNNTALALKLPIDDCIAGQLDLDTIVAIATDREGVLYFTEKAISVIKPLLATAAVSRLISPEDYDRIVYKKN